MFKNYLKIAWRNLYQNKLYTFINIFGLAVGIACCTLLLLYVQDELTFDNFHENKERIYRMNRTTFYEDGSAPEKDVYLPMPMGPALEEELPDVKNAVRFCSFLEHFVQNGKVGYQERVLYADANFFEVFTFPLVHGIAENALTEPNSVVLSERAAKKYFGTLDVVGKTLDIRQEIESEPYQITAVAKNPPSNSTIQFDVLLSFPKVENISWLGGSSSKWGWQRSAFQIYIELVEGSDLATNPEKLLVFRQTHYPDEESKMRELGRWTQGGPPVTYALQNITAIHLDPSVPGGISEPSNPLYSYLLLGIALSILFIACINFTTLAIGRSAGRAKEVGVRKVIGANRQQLMRQFWGEAALMSVLATVFAVILATTLLPQFNLLADKNLSIDFTQNVSFWLLLLGIVGVTSLLAGGYPSVVLSGLKPIQSLKEKIRFSGSNGFTQSLVVTQFLISLTLIISTVVMVQQLQYLQNKDLGYQKDQVMVINFENLDVAQALPRLRNELEQIPSIQNIAATNIAFGEGKGWSRAGFDYQGDHKEVFEYMVEPELLDLLDMDIVAGRNFNPEIAADSARSILINEAMVADFGWDNAVGERLSGYGQSPDEDPIVVGVVKDFNFRSLHSPIEPAMLFFNPDVSNFQHLVVKLEPQNMQRSLAQIEQAWNRVESVLPLSYSFMDEDLERFYQSEQRWSQIVGYSALITIFIACLGLLGLVSLTVTNRTKEIGIRKVLGASISSIVTLISKDFLKLVIIALVLATPLAWFAMNKWLSNFAYQIDMQWWVFAAAGLLTILVALLTISFQSIKAALLNPAESLKNE